MVPILDQAPWTPGDPGSGKVVGPTVDERVGTSGRRGNPVSRWLADRRIATKLLLVTAVAIAAAAAVGGLGLVEIEKLRRTRQVELGHEVPFITGLQSAALAAKAAANDERGFLITGDSEFRSEVQERLAKVRASLAQAGGAASTAEQRQAVDGIRQAIERWFAAIDEEFDRHATDKPGAIEAAFGPNRELRKSYEALLDAEITAAADRLRRGRDFTRTVESARRQVLVVLVTGLALALCFAFYLSRLIVVPLRRVAGVLRAAADKDLSQHAEVHSRDEIGQMAAALEDATTSLRDTIETMSANARVLATAADELTATSQQVMTSAAHAAEQVGSVSTAADQVSHNAQAVSAGSEEMTASIREIAQSSTEAARVAGDAVTVATSTNTIVSKLGESSAEIGSVIKVITQVAEQTNLLALNATIEAARAGDAGKGFAVVASEVKELAHETARATKDISDRVEAIQSDTSGAVSAIAEIGAIIARINDYQTTIAAAVEEQTLTTNEMSRGLTEAAMANAEIASKATAAAESMDATTAGIDEARQAAAQLAVMSGEMQQTVDSFRR
jgi:methyl-accepting chemotaxis protein